MIPISAQLKYNIDVVCEYIVKKIPIPRRNFTSPPHMIVIRSFDVNKPGYGIDDMKGAVVGGSITRVCWIFLIYFEDKIIVIIEALCMLFPLNILINIVILRCNRLALL